MKKIYYGISLFLFTSAQAVIGQTYCIKLTPTRSGDLVDVKMTLVANEAPFKLGTSNIQFKHKPDVVSTPELVTQYLSGTGNYNGVTLTAPTSSAMAAANDSLVSFNLNFAGTTGQGVTVNTGTGTDVAIVRFRVQDAGASPNLRPYYDGTKGSIVYNDNTATPQWLISGNNCPVFDALLPIEWLDISATAMRENAKNKTLVKWETASEKDNSYFEVQRSIDGKNFQKIGNVKAENRPSTYNFMDEDPMWLSGTNYYRVKQVDFNGSETFSKVVSVVFDTKGKFALYPTVATSEITLDTEGYDNQDFQIVNSIGQIVVSGKISGGIQQVKISELVNGAFILRAKDKNITFIKQ